MRTIILLLLFVSGFAYAQPTINNPTPYRVCDDNSDGVAAFDINVITPTIITQAGTLVSYHLTLADSQATANPINLTAPFTNTAPFNQTIYIRAWDIADPSNASFSTLDLVVSQKPLVSIGNPLSCIGNATTVTTTPLSPGSYSYSYTVPFGVPNPGDVSSFITTIEGSYFVAITDIVTGCVSNSAGTYVYFNPPLVATISATAVCDLNPASVSAGGNWNNPTFSWTVPSGASDPGSVGSFLTSIDGDYTVVVTDITTGCVSNQASTTVTSLASVTPSFSIPASVCADFILPTTSDNGISGTWSPAVVTTGTYLFTPSVGECATSFSTLITVLAGANANQAADLLVVDNPYDGFATFDLTSQNAIINSDSGVQIDYYPSLADAQNGSNLITNPAAYTNITNPQTIGVRVFDPASSNCANITSFDLVINDPNNVYIPDANFKSRLISLGVDSNSDNEIQITEASAFTNEMNLSYAAISDLTGIEAFTNMTILKCNNNNLGTLNTNNLTSLTQLDCSYNQISSLNVSNLINLKILNCASNLLTTLDVAPLVQLEEFNCSINQLTTMNADPLVNLKSLICSYNRIQTLSLNNLPNLERLEYVFNLSTSLTFSNVPNMKYLDCSANYYITALDASVLPLLERLDCRYNALTAIDVSSLSSLNYLDCSGNQLTSLNVSGLNNLATLFAYINSITTIDLTNLPNLRFVAVYNNQLTTLDFSGSTNVSELSCNYNQLATINMAGLINLNYLNCQNNQLTTLDFEGLKALATVQCDNNLLTSLDFSTATSLNRLSCSFNNLSSLNVKNGNSFIDTIYSWSQNPILTFVCADESKLAAINQILNQSINVNNANIVFNSYCSFVPGGYYNTINGQMKLDANNNGCDASDLPKQFIKVNITDGINPGATFTDANGNYKFYTSAGSFNVSPETENPSWFSFSPATATISFGNLNDNITVQDFCIVPNGSHQDIEIVIEPIDAARPGYAATYKMVYRNKGNVMVSGSLDFNYDDSLLDFTSATIPPASQNTGLLNWNYTDLLPFESRSFYLTFNVNAATDTPPVNVGSVLNFNASINPVATDENQGDNQFAYHQAAVSSSDPNAITCIEGESVSPVEIGNYLHYVVNFENTGSYLAENVVVRTEINAAQFDIATLQLLSAPEHCYTRITGNIVEFIFEGINLSAVSGNPPVGGHGDILFKIKTRSDLVANDVVSRQVNIFFDYNAPIITPAATTAFTNLSNAGFEIDSSIKIYPNPTTSRININADTDIKTIMLYDIQGRILQAQLGSQKVIDIAHQANGLYFLKIVTDKGSKVEKIIKE